MTNDLPPTEAIMLLETVLRRGASLRVNNGVVQWRPKDVLTPAERAAMRRHQDTLVAMLAANGGAVTPAAGYLADRERWTHDPRADLTADTTLWQRLLALAFDYDGNDPDGLFGALHGLRCCGAELRIAGSQITLVAGELGVEFPALHEHYLRPHDTTLAALLEQLGRDVFTRTSRVAS